MTPNICVRPSPERAREQLDNWGGVAAARRPEADINGILIEGRGDIGFLDGDRVNKNFAGRTGSRGMVVSFDGSSSAASNLPRKTDKLTVLEVQAYEMLDVLDDGKSRILCQLSRAS